MWLFPRPNKLLWSAKAPINFVDNTATILNSVFQILTLPWQSQLSAGYRSIIFIPWHHPWIYVVCYGSPKIVIAHLHPSFQGAITIDKTYVVLCTRRLWIASNYQFILKVTPSTTVSWYKSVWAVLSKEIWISTTRDIIESEIAGIAPDSRTAWLTERCYSDKESKIIILSGLQ